MITTRMFRRGLALGLVAAVFALGWSLVDGEADDAIASARQTEAGMTVRIDPEHGIVPRTHQSKPIASDPAPSLGKSSATVEIVEHPGGMRSAVLHEGFMSTSVARIGEDGKVVTDCLDSGDEVEAFLAGDRDDRGLEVR